MLNALNIINIGIGFFNRGICNKMLFPNPLFFDVIKIDICFGDIHLLSGDDFISANHFHLLLFFVI